MKANVLGSTPCPLCTEVLDIEQAPPSPSDPRNIVRLCVTERSRRHLEAHLS